MYKPKSEKPVAMHDFLFSRRKKTVLEAKVAYCMRNKLIFMLVRVYLLLGGVVSRDVRVYQYPRVYPTRLVPAGTGWVRVRRPRLRRYPVLLVRNTIFHDLGAIWNFYFFLSKSIAYEI